jgi:hypothetical protein
MSGRFFVWYATTGSWPEDQFEETMAAIAANKPAGLVAWADGDLDVTSAQRKRAVEVVNANNVAILVFTESRITRGVVTAASWLGANIKACAFKDAAEHLPWLKVAAAEQAAIMSALETLKTEARRRVS